MQVPIKEKLEKIENYLVDNMRLIDSNILIYSYQKENKHLRDFISQKGNYMSSISVLECLGYAKISTEEINYFNHIFQRINRIEVSDDIIESAIQIARKKKTSLADYIIGATAIQNDLTLVTKNIKDYEHLEGIKLHNPL